MTIAELIEKLEKCRPEAAVMFVTSPRSCLQRLAIYEDEKGQIWFDIELVPESCPNAP